MKKYVAMLAVIAVFVFAASANAVLVGVSGNVNGDAPAGSNILGPAEAAGSVPLPNWNDLVWPGNGTTTWSDVNDSAGAPTTVDITIQNSDTRDGGATVGADANIKMVSTRAPAHFSDSSNNFYGAPTHMKLEEISATTGGAPYDLYVYLTAAFTGTGELVVDAGTANFGRGMNGHGAPWPGTIGNYGFNVPDPDYDANNGFISGQNMVVVPGRTEDSINIQMYPYFGGFFNGGQFQGVQIVWEGAGNGGVVIPEPAGLGVVGLALLAVRRRRS